MLVVATALTVYGIETFCINLGTLQRIKLQQRLPFTVLKLDYDIREAAATAVALQQRLPFTVLKPSRRNF